MKRGIDDPRFVPIPGPEEGPPPEPVNPYKSGVGSSQGLSVVTGLTILPTEGVGSSADSSSVPRGFAVVIFPATGSVSSGATVNGFAGTEAASYLLLMSGGGDRLLLANGTDSLLLAGEGIADETFTGYDGEPFTDYAGEYLTGV
jgi:hypothetical protein